VIDTLRADHLSCYGNTTIRTPHIDRLASQGILFANHFSQSSITNPSHASIFTSLYPKNHGLYGNYPKLDNAVTTLAEILRENDYKTVAAVSAFHLNSDYSGFGQGFDDYYNVEPPADHKGNKFIHLTRRARRTSNKVFEWLERNHRKRFFMWVHYFDPHNPYSPPRPFNRKYYKGNPTDPENHSMDEAVYPKNWTNPPYWLENVTDIEYVKGLYKGEVTYTDSEVGKLLKYLKGLDLEENTLVILTSDHGENLGEHKMYFDHWGLHKTVLHVPLIMRHPRLLPTKRRVKSHNMSIDILPTTLELLDIGFKTSDYDGQSLCPLFGGNESNEVERFVYSEHMKEIAVSMRNSKWAIIKDLKTEKYTSLYTFEKGKVELYDLENDPGELQDIAKKSELVGEFEQKINTWLKDRRPIRATIKAPEVSKDTKEKLRALGYAH